MLVWLIGMKCANLKLKEAWGFCILNTGMQFYLVGKYGSSSTTLTCCGGNWLVIYIMIMITSIKDVSHIRRYRIFGKET